MLKLCRKTYFVRVLLLQAAHSPCLRLLHTLNRCCRVQAFLDKAAVDKERARLAAENADLRTILQQYLDGISVNEAVMNNPVNPLLVINQRLQLTLAERNKLYQQPALQHVQPQSPTIKAVRPQLVEISTFTK